jgi:hypothetical protein
MTGASFSAIIGGSAVVFTGATIDGARRVKVTRVVAECLIIVGALVWVFTG